VPDQLRLRVALAQVGCAVILLLLRHGLIEVQSLSFASA